MGLAINELISTVNDLARQYTFELALSMPYGSPSTTMLLVNSTTMPGSTIDEIAVNYQGNVYKLGSTNTYDTWTVNFKVDSKADIFDNFKKWAKDIHNPQTGLHGVPSSYMYDQNVKMLDHVTGDVLKEMVLKKAWPSAVGEISLDYGSKEIAAFDVTFSYQWSEVL